MGSLADSFPLIPSRPHAHRLHPSLKERKKEQFLSHPPSLAQYEISTFPSSPASPSGAQWEAVCFLGVADGLADNVHTAHCLCPHSSGHTDRALVRHQSGADGQWGRAEQKSPSRPWFVSLIKCVTSAYFVVRSCSSRRNTCTRILSAVLALAWHSAVTTWPSACLSSPSRSHPAPIVRGEQLSEWET